MTAGLRACRHLQNVPRWVATLYLFLLFIPAHVSNYLVTTIMITFVINLATPPVSQLSPALLRGTTPRGHHRARLVLMLWNLFLGLMIVLMWAHVDQLPQWLLLLTVNGFALFLIFYTFWLVYRLMNQRAAAWHSFLVAICVYLLIAFICAQIYGLIYLDNPSSFHISSDIHIEARTDPVSLFLYFSIVTLTTLGYGDITPLSSLAIDVAMVEAVIGQMYVAVVVAWLVGLRLAAGIESAANKGQRTRARYEKQRNGRRVRG